MAKAVKLNEGLGSVRVRTSQSPLFASAFRADRASGFRSFPPATDQRVPHISPVLGEMWETRTLTGVVKESAMAKAVKLNEGLGSIRVRTSVNRICIPEGQYSLFVFTIQNGESIRMLACSGFYGISIISSSEGSKGAPYPEFPVGAGGFHKVYAAFPNESRARGTWQTSVQEIRVSPVLGEMWETQTLTGVVKESAMAKAVKLNEGLGSIRVRTSVNRICIPEGPYSLFVSAFRMERASG
jgi:hypothetical protein